MNYEEVQNTIEELSKQIEKDTQTERQCANLLNQIPWVLLPPLNTAYYVESELNCYSGRADLAIIAEVNEPGGEVCRKAYLWELKAPQVFLFKWKSGRGCPRMDLIEAENQLFHYYNDLKTSNFQRKWNLFPDDFLLGGIVIGRNEKLVKCSNEDSNNAKASASLSLKFRNRFFYNHNRMELYTWDQVLDCAKKYGMSHKRVPGDPEKIVDLTASIPYTEPPLDESS